MRPRARTQAPSAKCHASYRGDTYRQESGLGALAMEVSIHAHMPVRASTRYFGTSGAMYTIIATGCVAPTAASCLAQAPMPQLLPLLLRQADKGSRACVYHGGMIVPARSSTLGASQHVVSIAQVPSRTCPGEHASCESPSRLGPPSPPSPPQPASPVSPVRRPRLVSWRALLLTCRSRPGQYEGELATNSITYSIHDVYYVHCTTVPPPPPPDEPRSSKHDTARGSRADTTKVRYQAERSALRPGHEAMIRREGFLSPPPTGHEPASGIVESSATTNRQHHGACRRRYRGISVRHLCHLFVQPAVHRIFSSPAISSEPAQETMQEKAGS
ncbi:hypothetical protein PCL_12564 [Purpureocillium lilacinum]|uniref:Uncharacterized protein n=1 Tax=Purpureocillium lilacinum TaxID=33203 RepID=A0A2U3E9L6_PURLI|nr:hypothetical protein PCL_12564 [Purpureocillium lilacinum]